MHGTFELLIVLRLLLGAPLNALVTREAGLPHWYAPGESVLAREALEELRQAAEQEGVLLWVTSGYRDYTYQADLVWRQGATDPGGYHSYSAEPGHSEHQLGTTFDVAWPGVPSDSLDPRNLILFTWLEQNAHRFGYVISYPYKTIADWPYHNRWMPTVTEYIYEPWHIRYVGIALAERMHGEGYLDPASTSLPQDYYLPWPQP